MYQIQLLLTVLILYYSSSANAISTSTGSAYSSDAISSTTNDPKIHTFTPMTELLLLARDRDKIDHDDSEHTNNLRYCRNGHGVTLTDQGLCIAKGGFLYEKLVTGFSDSIDLCKKSFRIQYTTPTAQNLTFTLFQSIDQTNTLGSLNLKPFVAYKYSAANTRYLIDIPVSHFQKANGRFATALRINGPVTVHSLALAHKYSETLKVIDDCKSWQDPFKDSIRIMFAPYRPYRIQTGRVLNVNLGGGGDTVHMMHYPFATEDNYAFRIQYNANKSNYRLVQVLQELWTGSGMMQTQSLMEQVMFESGPHSVLIRMQNVTNVCGIIVHGPLLVNRIDVVSLRLYGRVKSNYFDPDFDFGLASNGFYVPEFDFYG